MSNEFGNTQSKCFVCGGPHHGGNEKDLLIEPTCGYFEFHFAQPSDIKWLMISSRLHYLSDIQKICNSFLGWPPGKRVRVREN